MRDPFCGNAVAINCAGRLRPGHHAAERCWMQVVRMTEVQYIVRKQTIVAIRWHISADGCHFRGFVDEAENRNEIRIGLIRLSHPDPDRFVTFDYAIGSDAQSRRNGPMRIVNTLTIRAEHETMIPACDSIAFEPPSRQGRKSMRAAVEQCREAAISSSEEYDRFIQNRPAKWLIWQNFLAPSRLVPGVPNPSHFSKHPCFWFSYSG